LEVCRGAERKADGLLAGIWHLRVVVSRRGRAVALARRRPGRRVDFARITDT